MHPSGWTAESSYIVVKPGLSEEKRVLGVSVHPFYFPEIVCFLPEPRMSCSLPALVFLFTSPPL